ncbi:MAG: DNA polymerase Y family protein, partial [Pseudomonadota bacterium]
MLWIALYLPELPLQLAQRAQQTTAPSVVADGPALRPLVRCANGSALARGVKVDMPVAAARALAGELVVVPRDENAEAQALHNLCCWAGQFTPSIVLQANEGLLLEVESTLTLHGGLSRLLVRIGKGITELGYQAEPGIAPTPLAAWMLAKARSSGIATRMCKDSALLPERLAALPLTLFDWPADVLTTLQTLGVRTIGQCLQLPRAGFNRRFGRVYQLDLDKALGSAADPRLWFTPPDTYASRIEFGFELNDAMMLLFPLK